MLRKLPATLGRVLEENPELYRLLVETSIDPLAVLDDEAVFLCVSPEYERLVGRPAEALVGSNGFELVHPDDVQRAREALENIVASGSGRVEGLRLRHADGDWIVIDGAAQTYADGEGSNVIVAFSHDVTERTRAEAGLRASEERYRRLVEEIDAVVWEADPISLTFTYVSPRAVDLLGYPLEEWYEPGFWEARLHPEDRERTKAACLASIANAEDHELLYRMQSAGGEDVWLRDFVRVVAGEDGEVELVRGVLVDMTAQVESEAERERLTEDLLQAQKLDAIGRLAGSIAHDFNNLITAIRGYAELALAENDSEPVREELREIRAAAERAAGLTRQLLAFSRRQELIPDVLDLNEVVVEMAGMLQRLIGTHVELAIDLVPALRRTEADPSQMQQIVLNLTLNARDAMPGGGRLDLETANVDRHGRRFVALSVADTGIGMDTATRERLFDPFFTTKPVGEGTGLGLATVHAIVERAGGEIEVESEVGRGTRFRILLPAIERD